MFATTIESGVLQAHRPDTRWLATGHDGGYRTADAAYNVSVPEGFDRTDLGAYRTERREHAGFTTEGPTLLTGVDLTHARGARAGPVTVLATAGVSNPAALPMVPTGEPTDHDEDPAPPGTVNLLVGTTRALSDGALATLLSTTVEAKTATLVAETGFTGTTSDAVVVGCDPTGQRAEFAGSATEVGAATRACVRDAVVASLDTRYDDGPPAPGAAEYGVVTDRQSDISRP